MGKLVDVVLVKDEKKIRGQTQLGRDSREQYESELQDTYL